MWRATGATAVFERHRPAIAACRAARKGERRTKQGEIHNPTNIIITDAD